MRTSDEIMYGLSAILNQLEKTAAKKEDKEEEKDEDKKDEDKKEDKEEEKDEDKKEKAKKKAAVLMSVVTGLQKLATELDEAGAEVASSAVDDALRIIVENMGK